MKFSFTHKLYFCIAILSIFLALGFLKLYEKYKIINELEERVVFLHKKQERRKENLYKEETILSQIQSSSKEDEQKNPLNFLCSQVFLQEEQQKWKMFLAQTGLSHKSSESIFKENRENKLQFAEKSKEKTPLFEEIKWEQTSPIHLNEEDLIYLLSSLDQKEHAPQIVITSFSLEKKQFSEMQERVYALQMNLLTRQKN
jgi:hypothetical protein